MISTAVLELTDILKDLTRKLKLKEKFFDDNFNDESIVKSKSNFNPQTYNSDLQKIIDSIEIMEPIQKNLLKNISKSEEKALRNLISDSSIIIKKADKGNTLILMDKDFYRDKLVLKDHLFTSTYCPTHFSADKEAFANLKILVKKFENNLTKKEFKYVTDFDWKTSNLYVQPKIHKNNTIIEKMKTSKDTYIEMEPPNDLKARPIIAGPKAPTQHLSELIEKIISPLVPKLKSFIKDDWDFQRKFPRFLNYPATLYSCDIESLYTNISHDLGLTALEYYINKYRHIIPSRFSKEFILKSAAFILQNNNFMFDNVLYHQLIGTAMGTIFAPPYACLSIGFLEETKLYPEIERLFPDLYSIIIDYFSRYMDDGIVPWPDEANIDIFLQILNSLDPNIRFTLEKSIDSQEYGMKIQILNFLDLSLILHADGKIETDIFYKETNSHEYLRYDSHHPKHIKDNIPYTLAKKIIVFCTNYDKEQLRLKELKKWLLNSGYPNHLIEQKFHKARLQGPANEPITQNKEITFVTTFSSKFDTKNITKKCQNLLKYSKNERLNTVFKDVRIITAMRQPKNLLRQLTSAKFQSNRTPQLVGLRKCQSKKCILCANYIVECNSFVTANSIEWIINTDITCNSLNVIYYLSCLCCNKTTYIGKTNNMRKRMNCHISEIRTGNTTNKFDKHVINCKLTKSLYKEPFFNIKALIKLPNERLLLPYEAHFHSLGLDTLNS